MVPNVVSALLLLDYLVKKASILVLYFTLSDFHNPSPTLLHEIYFLVLHMPKNDHRKMNMHFDLNLASF